METSAVRPRNFAPGFVNNRVRAAIGKFYARRPLRHSREYVGKVSAIAPPLRIQQVIDETIRLKPFVFTTGTDSTVLDEILVVLPNVLDQIFLSGLFQTDKEFHKAIPKTLAGVVDNGLFKGESVVEDIKFPDTREADFREHLKLFHGLCILAHRNGPCIAKLLDRSQIRLESRRYRLACSCNYRRQHDQSGIEELFLTKVFPQVFDAVFGIALFVDGIKRQDQLKHSLCTHYGKETSTTDWACHRSRSREDQEARANTSIYKGRPGNDFVDFTFVRHDPRGNACFANPVSETLQIAQLFDGSVVHPELDICTVLVRHAEIRAESRNPCPDSLDGNSPCRYMFAFGEQARKMIRRDFAKPRNLPLCEMPNIRIQIAHLYSTDTIYLGIFKITCIVQCVALVNNRKGPEVRDAAVTHGTLECRHILATEIHRREIKEVALDGIGGKIPIVNPVQRANVRGTDVIEFAVGHFSDIPFRSSAIGVKAGVELVSVKTTAKELHGLFGLYSCCFGMVVLHNAVHNVPGVRDMTFLVLDFGSAIDHFAVAKLANEIHMHRVGTLKEQVVFTLINSRKGAIVFNGHGSRRHIRRFEFKQIGSGGADNRG